MSLAAAKAGKKRFLFKKKKKKKANKPLPKLFGDRHHRTDKEKEHIYMHTVRVVG